MPEMKVFEVSRKETLMVVAESLDDAARKGLAFFEMGYRDVDDDSSEFGYPGNTETTEISITQTK